MNIIGKIGDKIGDKIKESMRLNNPNPHLTVTQTNKLEAFKQKMRQLGNEQKIQKIHEIEKWKKGGGIKRRTARRRKSLRYGRMKQQKSRRHRKGR